jgi:HAD superfamily hydrolase (TIGR01459 family)
LSVRILKGLRAVAQRYDGFILDLWGVLHNGQKPTPYAIEALTELKRAAKRIVILSNAPRRAYLVAKRVTEIGISPDLYHHLHTSGEETWRHLKQRDDPFYRALGPHCFLIGPQRDDNMLEDVDLRRVSSVNEANFILNTGPNYDETVEQYQPLLDAARSRSLKMVCANPDLVVQIGDRLNICAGAIAQRYEEMGGEVRWHGKPLPGVYETVFSLLGVADRRRILAIGDSIRTDIAGANAAGIDSLFVVSGIHAEELSAIDPQRLHASFSAQTETPTAVIDYFRW